jgi:hypothetical protein
MTPISRQGRFRTDWWRALSQAGRVVAVGVVGGTLLASVQARQPGQAGTGQPATGAITLLPDTSDRMIPFADQLDPNYSDHLVEFVANHFAGTQKMLKRDDDRFKAENPHWVLLHYRLGVSSGPAQYIHNDLWSSDWSQVNPHEDWFLHNEAGKRHYEKGSNWYIHDLDNPGFREYWTSSVIADMRATSAQGVFADSFEAGVSGYGVTPPDARFAGSAPADPQAWKSGRTWMAQKLEFIDYVRQRFAATPEKFMFVANLGGLTTTWWWPHYANVDGAMIEGFALNEPFADWIMGVNRAMELTRAGKFVIAQAYPKSVEDRLFLIGSYLLIKGQRTFVNAGGAGVYYYPEYALSLGPASAPLPADVSAYLWNRIYKREFRDAIVLVNPRAESVTVTLPKPFSLVTPVGGGQTGDAQLDANLNYTGGSLKYSDVTTVTLPSRSAALLKRK